MELNVTPAGSLRLCKAMGGRINEVKKVIEPGMQADQWGEAGSGADGVRSNVTLGADRCAPMIVAFFRGLHCFILGLSPHLAEKFDPKKLLVSAKCNHAVYASTVSVKRQRALHFALYHIFKYM